MALKMSGIWMAESSSENRQTIDEYLTKSLSLLKNIDRTPEDDKSIVDTYHQLAKFTDGEYQQVGIVCDQKSTCVVKGNPPKTFLFPSPS